MTRQIIPSAVQTDYKRLTRMQAIAVCVGFAALMLAPSIIDAALSAIPALEAVGLALVALAPVALIAAAVRL